MDANYSMSNETKSLIATLCTANDNINDYIMPTNPAILANKIADVSDEEAVVQDPLFHARDGIKIEKLSDDEYSDALEDDPLAMCSVEINQNKTDLVSDQESFQKPNAGPSGMSMWCIKTNGSNNVLALDNNVEPLMPMEYSNHIGPKADDSATSLTKSHLRFVCNICNKAFTRNCKLTRHMRCHTGERTFSCDLCKKSFFNNTDLKRHMRYHTGEKPFSCNICKQAYSQKSYLTRHIQFHTGEKPFSCDLCNKTFKLKSHLTRHNRVHTRIKSSDTYI